MTEVPKVEEKPAFEEKEVDQVVNKKIKSIKAGSFTINPIDASLNALVDTEGCIASQIYADGLGHLNCNVRSTYGVKKGRYYYEISVLDAQSANFRIGFSTGTAKWVGGENSVAFTNQYRYRHNDEVEPVAKGAPPAFVKNDIIGVLLNLDPKSENKNTVSLFVNGKRASEPKTIPEAMLKSALYPHVSYSRCAIGFYFDEQQKQLPFTVAMIGQAPIADLEKSKVNAVDNPKAIFPVGLDTDAHVKEYMSKNQHYLELSTEYFKEWCKDSSFTVKSGAFIGIQCFDRTELLSQWLRGCRKNVIVSLGCSFFTKERSANVSLVPDHSKSCVVLESKMDKVEKHVYSNYEDAALPTEAEGFDVIDYITGKEKEEENLAAWKKDQKLRSKVTDLKVGDWYNERLGEWTKFVTEKKATDEGKQFTEEDWMLAQMRVELSNIVHAFKDDVADEERPSFPPQLLDNYYKAYCKKNFNCCAFACPTVEDLVTEHLADCMAIDGKGLLSATVEKDIAWEKIWELVNTARELRELRVYSGDEKSELKFTAQSARSNMNKPQQQQNQERSHQQPYHHHNKRPHHNQQRGHKRPMHSFGGAPAGKRIAIA